jgi:putative transport protein
MNLLCPLTCVLGTLNSFSDFLFADVEAAVITGILCGAVTNTPGLGAAQQTLALIPQLSEQSRYGTGSGIPFWCAWYYPTYELIIRGVFRIKLDAEFQIQQQVRQVQIKKLESVENHSF